MVNRILRSNMLLGAALLALLVALVGSPPAHGDTRTSTDESSCGRATQVDWTGSGLLGLTASATFVGNLFDQDSRYYEARVELRETLGSRTGTLTLIPRERQGGPVNGTPASYEGQWDVPYLSTDLHLSQDYPGGQLYLKLVKPLCSDDDASTVSSAAAESANWPTLGTMDTLGHRWQRI